jgi:TolC family type I secretion outer membrane protein
MTRRFKGFQRYGIGGVLLAVLMIGQGAAMAQSLQEALAKAYVNNPTLRAARAELRAVDEGVPQSLSGWRPTLELNYDIGKTHSDSAGGSSSGAGNQNRTPKTSTVSVEQNLFQGFRTVSGTDEAEQEVKAQRARLASTEQTVLFDAATAYMDVLRDGAVLNLNISNERVLGRQLQATRDRFEVGEVTRTDVAQAESRLSSSKADRIQSEGDLVRSRARFLQVVGDMPETLKPTKSLGGLPASEKDAISRARAKNPNVIAAKFEERSSKSAIKSAAGALLPTVDLVGRLRRSDQGSSPTSRSETASITAQLVVPLYQAGAVTSRIRQAKQVWSQRKRELDVAMWAATQAATDAWKTLETAQAQIAAFTAAVRAGEIALEGVRQEAQVGSRTVLDVLDAEQELLNARVSLVRAERDAVVASVDLRRAVGTLRASNLKLSVEPYDPEQNYRAVRGKWFGTGIKGE